MSPSANGTGRTGKSIVKQTGLTVLQRLRLEDRARHLLQVRTRHGRRAARDDRNMALFMASILAPDACCVDVGAHKGWILQEMVRLAPLGKHMAFEPIPELAAKLAVEFPAVDVNGVALSDEEGEAAFQVAEEREQSGLEQRGWLKTGYEAVTVPVRRLDDLVPPGRRVDFLKIDVEGAQGKVLLGSRRVLTECHPPIWFEHGERSAGVYGTTTSEIWELLTELGYRVWTADGDGPLSRLEMEAANDMPMWTYMAHV